MKKANDNHTSAKFISIEGVEGAGKSTLMTFLQQWFREQQIPSVFTREPGGTRCGEMIRDVLLTKQEESILPLSELLLMFAARVQHIEHVIRPALQAKKYVICDRFTDASYAYQGAGRGIPLQQIEELETWVQQGLQPDVTLLLDIPIPIAMQRIQQRAQLDRFESEQQAFFERIRQCYLQRANAEPHRFHVIDAQQDIHSVQRDVVDALQAINT